MVIHDMVRQHATVSMNIWQQIVIFLLSSRRHASVTFHDKNRKPTANLVVSGVDILSSMLIMGSSGIAHGHKSSNHDKKEICHTFLLEYKSTSYQRRSTYIPYVDLKKKKYSLLWR